MYWRRPKALWLFFFIGVSLLGGCERLESPDVATDVAPLFLSVTSKNERQLFEEDLHLSVILANPENKPIFFHLGHSLKRPDGSLIDQPSKPVLLKGGEKKTIDFAYPVEVGLTGAYDAIFAAWTEEPGTQGARRLADVHKEGLLRLYRVKETFTTIDRDRYYTRSGHLGPTILDPSGVFVHKKGLAITLFAGGFTGGEIATIEKMDLGAVEVDMMVPNAPGSITGFFFYKAPDFFHEIDIEVFNDPSGRVLYTSYAEGLEPASIDSFLPFDPTKDFHTYRIERKEESVVYFVDQKWVATIDERVSTEPMQLMINAWYPAWTEAEEPQEDHLLLVRSLWY